MKKIVSIGGGCYRDGEIENIIEYIVSLSPTYNKRVVYLPTAGRDDISDINVIQSSFEKFGCNFIPLLLTDKSMTKQKASDLLLNADIVYVGGGDVKFMMDTWNELGVSDILRCAYNNGTVMSGYSAGAVCWYSSAYDDCGENRSFIFYNCLGILPFCCCPHYESMAWQSFKSRVKTIKDSGVAIENGAALVNIDGRYSVIHGNDGGDVYFLDANSNHNEVKLDMQAQILNK